MFEQESASQPAQTDLTQTQADEVTGRPSGEPAQTDGLNTTDKTAVNADEYKELQLPPQLQACGENLTAFKKLAAELKLPAQTAKKLVEWETSAAAASVQNAREQRAEILQRWTDQTKEMLGARYEQKLAYALDAARRFGGDELRSLLDVTGLGSHPAVVKAFYQISRQLAEDSSVSGRAKAETDKTFAEALYGKAQ